MDLQFIGIDPNTGDGESPTVWVDQQAKELVLQGWKPGPDLEPPRAARSARTRPPPSCAAGAFETVWERGTPHDHYKIS